MPYIGQQPLIGTYNTLDSIKSQQNSVKTSFDAMLNGEPFILGSVNNCFIVKNGLMLTPVTDYSIGINGKSIVFTVPPVPSDNYSLRVLGSVFNFPSIADNIVVTSKLADGSVTNIKLADGSISTAKILDGSVTSSKILDGNVTATKIASNAITTPKITDGAITRAKLNSEIKPYDVTLVKPIPFVLNTSTPTTHIDVSPIEFLTEDYTPVVINSTLTKRINAVWSEGTTNGGLDTGVVASLATYFVFVIYNPSTGFTDAIFSLSENSPTLPGGYTKKIKIGSVTTNSSSQIISYAAKIQSTSTLNTFVEGISSGVTNYVIKHGTNFDSTNRFMFANTGNFTATGNISAYSDIKLKENVEQLSNALETVKALRGVSYTRKQTQTKEIGLIAQEVEKILPELVLTHNDDSGETKSITYQNMVAVLIEAVKELSEKVEHLENASK